MVLDPGVNATARAGLAFTTTPMYWDGSLLSRASARFSDVFSNFLAGSQVDGDDIQLACGDGYGFLGAKTELWAAGEEGSLGDDYQGTVK